MTHLPSLSPRAICQITVELHVRLCGSVLATIQSYHCDMNEPLLWILIDDQDTLWDTAMSKIDERHDNIIQQMEVMKAFVVHQSSSPKGQK